MPTPRSIALVATCALALAALTPWSAGAADPLGLYVGAGIGEANVRIDESVSLAAGSFREQHSGWKAVLGLRPISLVGAELEYLDFGNPSQTAVLNGVNEASEKAAALMGVLYAPIPLPFIDVYAKAGLARLETRASGNLIGVDTCVVNLTTCGQFRLSRNDTDFAYGAGIAARFGLAGLRAEYERINASTGAPDMVSLSVIVSF